MDDKPITTEDLYGTSQHASEPASPPPPQTSENLVYEETPEIPIEHPAPPPAAPTTPPKESSPRLKTIGIVVVVAALFATGIWLSSYVREWLPQGTGFITQPKETPTPTPSKEVDVGAQPPSPYNDWISYEVISGSTKQAIPGISFKLPNDVLSPICDSTACVSQGTYLPGGTRFTVAARGGNQALKDYRGSTISDANGTAFTTKAITILGRQALEYSGTFAGRTISGYSFSRMRGVMIAVSNTESLEVNHFAPSGITVDFEADDRLFDQILESITISGYSQTEKGAAPITPTASATSSGY